MSTLVRAYGYDGRLIYACELGEQLVFTDEQLGAAIGFVYPGEAIARIVEDQRLEAYAVTVQVAGIRLRAWPEQGVQSICASRNGKKATAFWAWARKTVFAEAGS